MGVPKLTIEIEGIPIIRRVVRAALESELHRVILVIGPADSQWKDARSSGDRSPFEPSGEPSSPGRDVLLDAQGDGIA